MISLIAGTNRPNSRTRFVTNVLHDMLIHKVDEEINQINLEDVSHDIYHEDMYIERFQQMQLTDIQDSVIIPSKLWIIVSPEYNGSFPGALKLFIDALSIRKYQETFKGKKVALVGVSSGRAGNLRGMEHLTGLLNYLGMNVFPNKLPMSSIENHVIDSAFSNEYTEVLDSWLNELVNF